MMCLATLQQQKQKNSFLTLMEVQQTVARKTCFRVYRGVFNVGKPVAHGTSMVRLPDTEPTNLRLRTRGAGVCGGGGGGRKS